MTENNRGNRQNIIRHNKGKRNLKTSKGKTDCFVINHWELDIRISITYDKKSSEKCKCW